MTSLGYELLDLFGYTTACVIVGFLLGWLARGLLELRRRTYSQPPPH